ncbi:heterokaryon incompatibility protein-domain-containing protein [Microdochium trichocladiopsis]|uniref:Heterokaryon incompatibility protein-domain-containing protein n=1 Tax=Microdochium trichocladiopsis TaxID=1682393 RepID=A0A9P9BMN3_9PEZI|nr:heterokaryon incompatibility protein-domain-containing protein [Microdochium trichocladiopsis]KAH7026443.1 heterokaryon incompatibility protein-domain-containing protein [Microdochium trichocladiopsis]
MLRKDSWILTQDGSYDSPLRCDLEVAQIESRQANPQSAAAETSPSPNAKKTASTTRAGYVALSYEWGTEDGQQFIQMGESSVKIRANLAEALRTIRQRYGAAVRGMRIWADSLCVDQQDPTDRSAHVLLMGAIYSQADEVLVWLGPERDQSDLAITLLHDLASTESSSEKDVLQLVKQKPASWLALDDLMRRTYWERSRDTAALRGAIRELGCLIQGCVDHNHPVS